MVLLMVCVFEAAFALIAGMRFGWSRFVCFIGSSYFPDVLTEEDIDFDIVCYVNFLPPGAKAVSSLVNVNAKCKKLVVVCFQYG